MPAAREYVETVRERVQRQPKFRRALFASAIQVLLSGEVDTGKVSL